MADQTLRVRIVGDSKKLVRAFKDAEKNASAFGKAMKNTGRNLSVGLTLPLAIAGGAAIKFASDFNESMNKVDVAFGKTKQQVKDFAKTTLKQFGIAEGSALDMAALFGDMATSMGLSQTAAANMSTQLVGLAGDLASFKNIDIEQATTALAGVFTGETESLKKLGIVMTEVNLKQFAMEKGLNSNIKSMTQAEKVALRYKFIMESTANAQGDFARTGGGAANQMRIFQESLKELSARFGQIILPSFTKLVTFANKLLQSFSNLSPQTKKIIVVLGGIAAALGPTLVAIGSLVTLAPAIGTALTVMMGPVGLIIAGLTAIAVIIYKNWAGIKTALLKISNYFIDLYNNSVPFQLAVNGIIMSFKNMLAVGKFSFQTLLTIIKTFAENFVVVFKGVGDIIMGIFTFDKDKIVKGFKDITLGLKENFVESFNAIKTDATALGNSVVDNFNEALKSKQIEKIVIPVEISTNGAGTDTTNVGGAGISTRPQAQGADYSSFASSLTPVSDMVQADNELLPTVLGEQQAIFSGHTTSIGESMNSVLGISSSISQSFTQLGDTIGRAFGKVNNVLGAFVGTLAKNAMQIIGQNLRIQKSSAITTKKVVVQNMVQSKSNAITSATQTSKGFGPAAAFVLPALIAGATALIVSAFSGLGGGGGSRRAMGTSVGGSISGGRSGVGGVTGFANGGIISGPTMGLVGEYPGARQNPEVIAPLNKLQSMIGNVGGRNNINVTGEVRVDGQDLLIAIERANETAGRIYGN